VGLCGSGLIDFLGGAAAVGWLNVVGRFDLDALRAAGRYRGVTENGHARHACLLADSSATADGRELVITEADVAEALKAKAAVAAGIRTLLETADLRVEQLDKLTLAGGFARHVRLPGVPALGLLPDLPPERFEVVGNGSLGGACLALLDRDAPDGFAAILAHAQTVELNLVPSFEANYVEALMLPQAGE